MKRESITWYDVKVKPARPNDTIRVYDEVFGEQTALYNHRKEFINTINGVQGSLSTTQIKFENVTHWAEMSEVPKD